MVFLVALKTIALAKSSVLIEALLERSKNPAMHWAVRSSTRDSWRLVIKSPGR